MALIVRQLVADQVQRGLDVVVACPPSGPLAAEVQALGAAYREWPAVRSPGPSSAGEAIRLGRVVRDVSPDLIHLFSSKAGLTGRLAVRSRTPTIYEPQAWPFYVGGAVGALARRWEQVAARWCDAIICACEGERQHGERAGVRANFVVVANGTNTLHFTEATEDDRRAARVQLGIDDRPLAICVGRLSRQKGQDVLLAAWPLVRARVPDAQLILVGDGPEAAALAARATEGAHFAGHRDDISSWLAAADVVVLPSRWDVMAQTMLEAMARGRSVVSTDVAGAREALGGDAGAVVPLEDPASLAEALATRLLDPDLAAAEGAVGRARAVERHDFRRVSQQTHDLYEEVLRRRVARM